MYFEVHALAGTAVVVALPLVGTFWVSFLVGSHPQRSFFLYYPDLCPRSRGCPVLTHIDLSVSARHHTARVLVRSRRLLRVPCAA